MDASVPPVARALLCRFERPQTRSALDLVDSGVAMPDDEKHIERITRPVVRLTTFRKP